MENFIIKYISWKIAEAYLVNELIGRFCRIINRSDEG